MSFVDKLSDVRWSRDDVKNRVASILDAAVPHQREHTLFRRMFSMMITIALPPQHPLRLKAKPLTAEQNAEVMAAAEAYVQIDALAEEAYAEAELHGHALEYELARAALAALPPAPEEGEDPDADRRAHLSTQLSQAAPEVTTLVKERDAHRNSAPAAEAPQGAALP